MEGRVLLKVLMYLLVSALAGCQSARPKTVLHIPNISAPISQSPQQTGASSLDSLIHVRDARWDTVLVGRDADDKYVDLYQGHKMSSLMKSDIVTLFKSANISPLSLQQWIGKDRTLNIIVLEMAVGQGWAADDPSKSLSLREKKWLAIGIGPAGRNNVAAIGASPQTVNRQSGPGWHIGANVILPLSKQPCSDSVADNEVGSLIRVGIEVVDKEKKPVFKRTVESYERLAIPGKGQFAATAQTALDRTYKDVLHRLVEIVWSALDREGFERRSDKPTRASSRGAGDETRIDGQRASGHAAPRSGCTGGNSEPPEESD